MQRDYIDLTNRAAATLIRKIALDLCQPVSESPINKARLCRVIGPNQYSLGIS